MLKAVSGQFCLTLLILSAWGSIPASAQVAADGTLATTVSQTGNNFTITKGSRSGNNLFHSFSQFSVPTNGSVFFNNAADIQNIFSRVTGGQVSKIDGLIRANGSANLFLLNPAGILFGPNAALNIGGSFTATTADRVLFADGAKFNVTDTSSPPLLSMSVPVGLQLGANAGPIQTQGIPASNFFYRPSQVFQAQSVALVGSQIDFDSTSITVPDGRIDLWAVRNADIAIDQTTRWQITSPADTADWGTVTLRQSSYLDTSGKNGGAINIRGRGLTLQDGSGISSLTQSNGQGQGITVKTTEFVDLLGVSSPLNYPTPGLFTSVAADGGRAGDITIETENVRIANGGWLQSIITSSFDFNTFQLIIPDNARTGDITVRASKVDVSGYNPFPDSFTGTFRPSAITTLIQAGTGNESGKITVEAERVRLQDGGRISTDLLGSNYPGFEMITTGKSGDIVIRATESLDIAGMTPDGFTSAVISAIQPSAQGQGGNITIDTNQLSLSDGGTISSGLVGSGTAGNITIRAKDVAVSDPAIDSFSRTLSGITVSVGEEATGQGGNISLQADHLRVFNGGQITSSSLGQGSAGNVSLQVDDIDVQGSHPLPNGGELPSTITASSNSAFKAGSVNITADTLQVRDRGAITVSNSGSGDAGNLNVTARQIFLDNGASLRAEVNGGSQGNIQLKVSDVLLLRHGSNITTNAQGESTGGNIDIQARLLVAVPHENSDIVANAVLGSGGNIQITTQGIFGLKFRPQLTPKSDITASSQFGVSGSVQINTIDLDPNSGLVELPANVVDPSQQIATGCSDSQDSRFVATGRGGVPQNPTQEVTDDRTWDDVRDVTAYHKSSSAVAQPSPANPTLLQATAWQRNPDGTVELVASHASPLPVSFVDCRGQATASVASSQ